MEINFDFSGLAGKMDIPPNWNPFIDVSKELGVQKRVLDELKGKQTSVAWEYDEQTNAYSENDDDE